ncbi:MAG: hypothetical protein F6K62_23465 [Sphaerospermopsis sp. SIO1G2]|nr:hypothetical protein [Sphaerospermopsis sp. SIO1G2]
MTGLPELISEAIDKAIVPNLPPNRFDSLFNRWCQSGCKLGFGTVKDEEVAFQLILLVAAMGKAQNLKPLHQPPILVDDWICAVQERLFLPAKVASVRTEVVVKSRDDVSIAIYVDGEMTKNELPLSSMEREVLDAISPGSMIRRDRGSDEMGYLDYLQFAIRLNYWGLTGVLVERLGSIHSPKSPHYGVGAI